MNPAVIALASAISWGSSDFLGGLSARRISPYQTVAIAHLSSLACILALVFVLHLSGPGNSTVFLGLIAGLFGGGGLVLFYEALSFGAMGLTAALCGVLTAAVPVLYGLTSEGLPQPRQLAGFVLAIAAIWIIAAAPGSSAKKDSSNETILNQRGLWFGAIAGICFGIYFVLLKLASERGPALSGVLWSITFSRVTSGLLASALCVWMLHRKAGVAAVPRIWNLQTFLIAGAVGLLDTAGNLFYMLATRLGRMDSAAVLTSLYPAVTILLAAWILHERTSRSQTAGMVLALAAVGLIAS